MYKFESGLLLGFFMVKKSGFWRFVKVYVGFSYLSWEIFEMGSDFKG